MPPPPPSSYIPLSPLPSRITIWDHHSLPIPLRSPPLPPTSHRRLPTITTYLLPIVSETGRGTAASASATLPASTELVVVGEEKKDVEDEEEGKKDMEDEVEETSCSCRLISLHAPSTITGLLLAAHMTHTHKNKR